VIRQTIEAVETPDVLTARQRDLIDSARTGRVRADAEAARPDLEFAKGPEVKLGDVELAVYRVVTDSGRSRETSFIVAPRDPRLKPGTDVAPEGGSSVLWSEGPGEESTEIHVTSRLVPFDWDAYWAAAAD
jgi:hypothetical protein